MLVSDRRRAGSFDNTVMISRNSGRTVGSPPVTCDWLKPLYDPHYDPLWAACEEFGVPGTESGPMTRWAMELILAAVRRGDLPELPGLPDAAAPPGSDTPQKDTP